MLTIAYLGPEKTNTHLAALKRFGRKARFIHAPTIDDVFELVERENADVGVVPIENSLEGVVTHTVDRFIDFKRTPIRIIGEFEFPIRHYFITNTGTKHSEVGRVYSHPQALAQCRKWIQMSLPKHVELAEMNSTSEAVQFIATNRAVTEDSRGRSREIVLAAIGHKEAARPLNLIAMPIPDERENKTRFLIIGLENPTRGRRNKTSILFALKDQPGALHDALMPFKRNQINLTKIESRPSKKKAWEYLFFIDFEGHESEPRVKRTLKALEKSTSLLRVLGSYPTVTRTR